MSIRDDCSLLSVCDPNQPFGTILADPAWPSKSHPPDTARDRWIGTNMRPRYRTMKPEDLINLPVAAISAPDSVLVLWSTWMHLDLAMRCIEAWGFRYATGMPWLKVTKGSVGGDGGQMDSPHPVIRPIFGPGVWFQHCTELVLIGRRGRPFGELGNPRPARKGIVVAPRGEEHSEKPREVQDWIDAAGFPGPKLEMFARRTRPGWVCWGDEVDAGRSDSSTQAEGAPRSPERDDHLSDL